MIRPRVGVASLGGPAIHQLEGVCIIIVIIKKKKLRQKK